MQLVDPTPAYGSPIPRQSSPATAPDQLTRISTQVDPPAASPFHLTSWMDPSHLTTRMDKPHSLLASLQSPDDGQSILSETLSSKRFFSEPHRLSKEIIALHGATASFPSKSRCQNNTILCLYLLVFRFR